MQVHIVQPFPGMPLVSVYAQLTIVGGGDGSFTVGHSVTDLERLELLALGCEAPCSWQDLPAVSQEALRSLRDAQGTLLDLPPFP